MTQQAIGSASVARLLDELLPLFAVSLVAIQALVSLVMVERRLADALGEPGDTVVLAAGLLIVVLAAAPRAVVRGTRLSFGHSRWNGIVRFAPSVLLFLTAAAVSVGGGAWWAIASVWTAAIAEEAWAWTALVEQSPLRKRFAWRKSPLAEVAPRRDLAQVPQKPIERTEAPRETSGGDKQLVWQEITRGYDQTGADVLRGRLRAILAKGQRTAHVHVAFCPPFARAPQIEFRQSGGPPARVKLGQLLPYGVRLDVKLENSPEATADVLLELTVREDPADDLDHL